MAHEVYEAREKLKVAIAEVLGRELVHPFVGDLSSAISRLIDAKICEYAEHHSRAHRVG